MTQSISEQELEFTFEDPVLLVRFDDDATHGMSHVMKRVDFIVRFATVTFLIEVKDPDCQSVPAAVVAKQRASFRHKMRTGALYRRELLPKLRDTLVYLALSNRAPENRIKYIIVLGMAALTPATLLTAQEHLKRLCYLPGPFKADWPSEFEVIVVNLATWNSRLAPHSVMRVP